MKNIFNLKIEIIEKINEETDELISEGVYEDDERDDVIDEEITDLEDSISKVRKEAFNLFSTLQIDEEELKIIKDNFDTNGKASLSILELMGYAIRENKTSEKYLIELVKVDNSSISLKELSNMLYAMGVANNRHNNTSYDNVSKKGMNDDQVSELRRMGR